MRCVGSERAWRVLAALVVCLGGLCLSDAALAQSLDIPLQLQNAQTGVILTINVGINGGVARPYLFDTGSPYFNAYYTSAADFGGLPPNMISAGLPTGVKTLYGDGPTGSNEYDANIIATPYLTFYATPNSSSGIRLNAVNNDGTPSQFLIGAVYFHKDLITSATGPLQATSTFPGYYGIFGANTVANLVSGGGATTPSPSGQCTSGCSAVFGSVLGQAVVPGTTAGYVVAANGLALSTLKTDANGSIVAGSLINGPQATQCAIASCDPALILGLTPALLAQFAPANTLRARTLQGVAFPNSNAPALGQFGIDLTVTVNGAGGTPITLRQPTLLDTGTVNNQLYASGLPPQGYIRQGATVTVSTAKPGAALTSFTTTRGDAKLPYSVTTDNTTDKTYLGIGFFLQNSVLFNLAGTAIGYTPNYVTDQNMITTPDAPFTIGASSVPLGLAGVISGAGGLAITPAGSATLSGTNTYTGATTIDTGYLSLVGPGSISASREVNITRAGIFDVSGVTLPGGVAIQSLSGDTSASVWLGANTLNLTNASGTFAGVLSGSGGLTLSSGTETLTGINVYSGATTVNGGMLVVNGVLAGTAGVQVNAGGALGGSGLIDPLAVAIASGGVLAPGQPGVPGTSLSIVGDLALQPGSTYVSLIGGKVASAAQISGTASLAGTLTASFVSAPLAPRYTVLSASALSGSFDRLTTLGLPPTLSPSLSYSGGGVQLNLASQLAAAPNLGTNQRALARALDQSFNAGTQPQPLGALYALGSSNLASGLATLSGASTAGAQQSSVLMMDSFLGLILDPFVDGRPSLDAGTGSGAVGYASSSSALSPGVAAALAAVKAPPAEPAPEHRWSQWGSVYGGTQSLGGNAADATRDSSAGVYGFASGADYRATPDTMLGFAVAGAGTSWSTTGLGSGQGSAAQLGVYGKTRTGPLYVAAALAFTYDWATTRRQAFTGDLLSGQFEPYGFGARFETGYRFDVATAGLPALSVSPYAAVEPQTFHMPTFAETGGRSGLALNYAAVDAVDTRTELGARLATSLPLQAGQIMNLWGRVAWAHDFNKGPVLTASFADLPSASFAVSSTRQAEDAALLSVGGELRMTSALSLLAKFNSRFAPHEQMISGSATLRYAW